MLCVIAHPDDEPRRQSYKAVPSAVFSNPQVAMVGLTEDEAIAEGIPHRIGRRDYGGTAYGWALNDETSFAKVLVNTETGLIIGAHVIGPHAATLIQPVIQAKCADTGNRSSWARNQSSRYISPNASDKR